MIKLAWAFAFMTAQGAATGPVGEMRTFDTMEACQAFGREMTPRTADFVRGAFKLDWSVKVAVAFHCQETGEPA